ncbi:hypothetical protein ACWGET_17655 [Streptomyces zaomyceticus]
MSDSVPHDSRTVEVRTYLQSDSGELVSIDLSGNEFHRDRYVQGAVEFRVGDVLLLGRENIDTIDALWSLMLSCLEAFMAGGTGVLRFPERMYVLTLKRIRPGNVLVRFDGPVEKRTAAGNEKDVLDGLLAGAVDFFAAVLESSPKDEWSYRRDLNAALRLREECSRMR